MKSIFLIFFLTIELFSFEAIFEDVYKKEVFLNKNAFSLQTSETIENIPFKYFKTENGYIVLGEDEVDEWIRNSAILPLDTYIQETKVGIVNKDKIRNNIIKKVNKHYKNCKLSTIEFLTYPKELYLKPSNLEFKTKIILECK
jgi:hypothetical protein